MRLFRHHGRLAGRRDQRAFRSANRTPLHFAAPAPPPEHAPVTSWHPLYAAGAAGFRLRLGGGLCAPLAEPQTEAG